ncbi:hypothetical protein [Micromonospora chokoriensis]|nr:hypothetical protein [Micromonospora chokoriensis]
MAPQTDSIDELPRVLPILKRHAVRVVVTPSLAGTEIDEPFELWS